MRKPGKIALVGAGPGDPGLLTLKAARAIAGCDTLVYDHLVSEPIVAMASPHCEKIYVGKKAGAHTLSQEEITALLVRLGEEGKRVVRLKGGDVCVFARGGEEAQGLHAAGIPFEIIPGITSALAAPAYAGIPITHRDHNTAFTIATGHEDPTKGYTSLDFTRLSNPAQTLVFLMAMGNLRGIVEQLLRNGMPTDMPTAIVREGTRPQQETLVSSLGNIVDEVERTEFSAPAIVIIGNVVRERESMRWFDTHPLFGKRILITRPAEQARACAAQLWEVGAEPILAPTIRIAPPDDTAASEEAVRTVHTYQWIVFSSVNGVQAFFARLRAAYRDARAFGDARVAAIGPKTAYELATHGIHADLLPARHISEDMAQALLTQSNENDHILIYGAHEARNALPDILRAQGRRVHIVAAYKTTYVDDPTLEERAASCDIWTFTSASCVRGLAANTADIVTLARGKHIACIGPITAQAAREVGLSSIIMAEEATTEALITALERA
jgi:uroporphyrinogen III methyltransferase / synthase